MRRPPTPTPTPGRAGGGAVQAEGVHRPQEPKALRHEGEMPWRGSREDNDSGGVRGRHELGCVEPWRPWLEFRFYSESNGKPLTVLSKSGDLIKDHCVLRATLFVIAD